MDPEAITPHHGLPQPGALDGSSLETIWAGPLSWPALQSPAQASTMELG